ncbi:MAG: CoA pyrophosphatase [Candidatus Eremiobacteraeota bacterium]|nr:CoA pyrophosphatase [Candidatus Eremiobacteraeota bacterium]MBV8282174.1 CoA pyrophosphatase [Candidatus Eremiobacteraeota bacterium]
MHGATIARLRELLQTRAPNRLREAGTRSAAVLVPLAGPDGELSLVCFERTHQVAEHKGEICFPGGSVEPQDADPVDAALREAHEELGLPRERVDVLGVLDDVHTTVSNYVITPVVGHLDALPALVPDPLEVARPVVVPLRDVMKPGAEGVEWRQWRGTRRQIYYYPVAGGRIWGATARILHNLLTVWSGQDAERSSRRERIR